RVARRAWLGEDLEPRSGVAERPRRELDPLTAEHVLGGRGWIRDRLHRDLLPLPYKHATGFDWFQSTCGHFVNGSFTVRSRNPQRHLTTAARDSVMTTPGRGDVFAEERQEHIARIVEEHRRARVGGPASTVRLS